MSIPCVVVPRPAAPSHSVVWHTAQASVCARACIRSLHVNAHVHVCARAYVRVVCFRERLRTHLYVCAHVWRMRNCDVRCVRVRVARACGRAGAGACAWACAAGLRSYSSVHAYVHAPACMSAAAITVALGARLCRGCGCVACIAWGRLLRRGRCCAKAVAWDGWVRACVGGGGAQRALLRCKCCCAESALVFGGTAMLRARLRITLG